MNILAELQTRFRKALAGLVTDEAELAALVDMVRPSQDPKFGDYQANFAMPLGKKLGRNPRDVAGEVVAALAIDDLCEPVEVAGPGFINLRLKTSWIEAQLQAAVNDERLGVPTAQPPKTYVIDYSAPNVAKPMHVGHIRSTVIGDALTHTLRFLGHRVISDNHIGDWGTQFGMIIYGFKHFRDEAAYQSQPVVELSRLYRLVNKFIAYHEALKKLPQLQAEIDTQREVLGQMRINAAAQGKKEEKETKRALTKQESKIQDLQTEFRREEMHRCNVEDYADLLELAKKHAQIGEAVLLETARLHGGDEENLKLWREFLPPCLADIAGIYERLNVRFDQTLGESFYHDRLRGVVQDLIARGLAKPSEGAICVFIEGQPAPMIIQKQDGAFLYATTDLATIQYRMSEWSPDSILYVVDHRQSLHFEQLFTAARRWGYDQVELKHVSFGTVLGEDGRPYKTRSGDTVGLGGLLDEAVARALAIVSESDDAKPEGPQLSQAERQQIADVVGIAALKYADLSQHRTSDYVFSYDKMLAMKGNTATYMQYAYARVRGIFAEGTHRSHHAPHDAADRSHHAPHDATHHAERDAYDAHSPAIDLSHPAERALGMALAQFSEALAQVVADYRPDFLTTYLFELANRFSTFYQQCHVLKAESPAVRENRLLLCDLTARTLQRGLALLGIQVVDRM